MPGYQWVDLESQFHALLAENLSLQGLPEWLRRWSDLQKLVWEWRAGLKRDQLRDVTDSTANAAYQRFLDTVFNPFKAANATLSQKLLSSIGDAIPVEYRLMLRGALGEARLFRPENLPLATEISMREGEYRVLASTLRVKIAGRKLSPAQIESGLAGSNRAVREETYLACSQAWLKRRALIDDIFLELLALRRRVAKNAGFRDYRAYRWQELGRWDYTPEEALALHDAISGAVLPLAERWHREWREQLGIPSLRPWDVGIEPQPGLNARLFPHLPLFVAVMSGVFARLDPELGRLFDRMRNGHLDLGRRKGKPGGGEEWLFPLSGLPYIHLDVDGTAEGVSLLLHEMGHAFHDFLAMPAHELFWRLDFPNEFAEFAAISMTYLAAPFLTIERGGFYAPEESSLQGRKALRGVVMRWLPYISLVDSYQHWLYTEAPENVQPSDLDAQWGVLSRRFMPWIDWTGLEEVLGAGWQQAGLIFTAPFYMIEYALAHLGALQVWRNAERDHSAAWAAYRAALSLGSTRPLPALFAAAGVKLPFDPGLVRSLIDEIASAPW